MIEPSRNQDDYQALRRRRRQDLLFTVGVGLLVFGVGWIYVPLGMIAAGAVIAAAAWLDRSKARDPRDRSSQQTRN